MSLNYTLSRKQTGLLIVDVQDKLVPHVDRACEVVGAMQRMIKAFRLLNLPIFVTEQYPKGLGPTISALKHYLGDQQKIFTKTTFSCLGDPSVREKLLQSSVHQWVLMGLEAHVCVLQSAKDLLTAGQQVVVLNDCITSRSIYHYSTAIAEMRDCGARISCTETVLFELLRDSTDPAFKEISLLIK